MPDQSGIDALPAIQAAAPDAKVLVIFHARNDPSYVHEAFAAGALGYVLKEVADWQKSSLPCTRSPRRAATSTPRSVPDLSQQKQKRDPVPTDDPLSEREREVLRLLALGHTNQEIAKMLYISVRTAETHRAHIMQKLRLTTRAELVRYAIANGMLDE